MYLHKLIPHSWASKSLPTDLEITDISADSRQVVAGMLFVAQPGLTVDGRDFLQQAVASGAVAIIYEQQSLSESQRLAITELTESSIPLIAVSALSEKLGYLAAEFFGNPSQSMSVFAVTGTNGKTSSAYLLAQSLQLLGYQSAFLGTIGWGAIGDLQKTTHTTADAVTLQRQLAQLLEQGFTHVCMEVSSHALAQHRVKGMQFYAALFTNLSHDHLDYHGSMANYADVKRRLFTDFDLKFVITNNDDEMGQGLIDIANAEFIASYGANGDVSTDEVRADAHGLKLLIEAQALDFTVQTQLVGLLNVPNVLLVTTTLLVLGVAVDDIQSLMPKLLPADGRMEVFRAQSAQKATMVVDYAHTPDALERALLSCREHCAGRLWLVFGCGGDRDQQKRPKMGEIAQRCADYVVITADNSRSESTVEIFNAIQQGMPAIHSAEAKLTLIEDRAAAIQWTVAQAQPEDWVLIAGKGHESQQINGGKVIEFSDRQWVAQCLEAIT